MFLFVNVTVTGLTIKSSYNRWQQMAVMARKTETRQETQRCWKGSLSVAFFNSCGYTRLVFK